jgi:hypothetical protein
MYRDRIRNLEKLVEDQTNKISSLSKDNPEYTTLIDSRSTNLQELSSLRKLQWEEDHERVRFDDDR